MHPIQDLFLEVFHMYYNLICNFYMHSYVDKKFHSCKKWVLQDNCYLQIRRHEAYVVGSCVGRLTQEVDVHTVRIQYSVSAREGSKGQALADLIAERITTNVATLSVRAWAMYFDGSACEDGCGVGILLVSP
jgi:hypothetical protein